MDDLQARIQQTIFARQLLPAGSSVIVGVSGGADSVALLHLLHELCGRLRLSLRVAHLDHQLRKESHADALFVKQLAQRLNVPAVIERQPVADWCDRHGWSLEEGARNVRYRFFRELANRYSAQAVALAHTADDQAETVLMRLIRGSGLAGLSAMTFKRPLEEGTRQKAASAWLVRPLLTVWRREILVYLNARHLDYREDATNSDCRFVRNRIRHQLLPLLERDYNPNLRGVLTQLAEQSRCDDTFLQSAASRQAKRIMKATSAACLSIRIDSFLKQPEALQRQLVRRAIKQLRGDLRQFEFRHWIEVERIFLERPEGTKVHLPGGLTFCRKGKHVLCQVSELAAAPA